MTRQEFTGQFDRLCRGLDYQASAEQAEAMYRRVGHVAMSVWAESVTSLLCDGRKGFLPKLEHVLSVVEQEAESQRRVAVEQDKFKARKTYVLLHQPVNPDEQTRIPSPGSPLFTCIKAYAGRKQCLKAIAALPSAERMTDPQRERELARYRQAIQEYDREIAELSPLLHEEDAGRLVKEYETEVHA